LKIQRKKRAEQGWAIAHSYGLKSYKNYEGQSKDSEGAEKCQGFVTNYRHDL